MILMSEYATITASEIKALILFDFDSMVYHTGDIIVNDDFIQAQINISSEEVYAHILREEKPASYKPDGVRVVIKKLAKARVENAMLKAKIMKEGTLVDLDDLFEKNKHFIFHARKEKEVVSVSNAEDFFYPSHYDDGRNIGW